MSVALRLEMPDGAFSALHKNPDEFGKEMRLVAAVKWYEMTAIKHLRDAEIIDLPFMNIVGIKKRFRFHDYYSHFTFHRTYERHSYKSRKPEQKIHPLPLGRILS